MGYTIWPDGVTGEILQAVYRERSRQDDLKEKGKFPFTCADSDISHFECYAVLGEEFGEVGHELNESISLDLGKDSLKNLKKELVQVAAVAVAWAEKVDDELRRHG